MIKKKTTLHTVTRSLTRRPSRSIIIIMSHLCSRSARAAAAEPWFRPGWPPLFPYAPAAAEHRATWVAPPPPLQDHPLHTHQNNLVPLPLGGHPTPASHARTRKGTTGGSRGVARSETPKILRGFLPKHRRACLRNSARQPRAQKRLTYSHYDDDDDDESMTVNSGSASSNCARALSRTLYLHGGLCARKLA